jgi:tripartite-type tricarboxylate transporter receptor subunit TctC
MVGGQVDFGCIAVSGIVSQIQGGTIKAIAVASAERATVLQDVPTTTEAGLPQFHASSWNAIFAPKNLPSEVQANLNAAVVKALDDEATRKRLLDLGCVIPSTAERTPQALQELVNSEVARWSSVLKVGGVSAN